MISLQTQLKLDHSHGHIQNHVVKVVDGLNLMLGLSLLIYVGPILGSAYCTREALVMDLFDLHGPSLLARFPGIIII